MTRFRYQAPDGHEIEIAGTGELALAFLSGELQEDTLLFDAEGGGWAPARSHSVFLTLDIPGVSTAFTLAESKPIAPEDALAQVLRDREDESSFGASAMEGLTSPASPLARTYPSIDRPAEPRSSETSARSPLPEPLDASSDSEAAWEEESDHRVEALELFVAPGRAARGLLGAATAALAGLATSLILVVLVWDSGSPIGLSGARAQEPSVALAAVTTALPPGGPSNGMSTAELQAYQDMVGETGRLRAKHQVTRVPSSWLEGIYLASASDFPEVRKYWESFGDYVREVQEKESELYRTSFVARLERRGVETYEVSMLLARALRTFEADRARREALYASLLELSTTAVELHDLLVAREGEISFEPARSGVSRNPVVEAVAQNRELEAQMNGLLDRMFMAIERAQGERVVPRNQLPRVLEQSLIPNEAATR
jgi:hypothetical protein